MMTAKQMTFCAAVAAVQLVSAQAVLPGYLTDPTAVKGALGGGGSYQPPEALKYPYLSTYYVKPTVTPDEDVKIGFFVTDFESSKIRFLDDTHRFSAFLEYRAKGGASKVLTLKDLRSGDAEFNLGKLPAGEYEMRVWAVDAKGRESHRVIHDFRVKTAADFVVSADKIHMISKADLAAYGIRNDGDFEKIVYVGSNSTQVVKEKRAGVPGYTVSVPLDPKTGKVPYRAFEKISVAYDEGYDKAAVEAASVATAEGLQRLIDEKAAAGFRMVSLMPGTYRLSHTKTIHVPDNMTLNLGKAVLKQNGFTGASSVMVRISSAIDAHLVGGTLEGDYWEHDYAGSEKNSEWPAGFEIGGDSWYCSVDGVKVVDITGYGGQNGIGKDAKGDLAFFYEGIPAFAPGGLDLKTGEVDARDAYRFTSDFKSLKKITEEKGRRRLQVSKYLGYQGIATRSWQMTVAWYDAAKTFISAETAWQYREMWIPENAAFLRVSVEEESLEAANKTGLTITAFRYPVNCAVRNCRFERCRCVGYAASAMKNMLFEGNFFTQSGEALAKCAFDAEDGWDQMQDVYFLGNVFRDNPLNNSILTCAGHNFILEKNEGDVYFWGRTHSPCVRDNGIGQATYWCDSRLRSGYGRFDGNRHAKGIKLGMNERKPRPDNWDCVLSGRIFDGAVDPFKIEAGPAGRLVGCTFRNMESVGIANAYACAFENCKGWFSNARWVEVTVKDSVFKGFYHTNILDRCRFENTSFDRIDRSVLRAKNCDFTGSTLFGLNGATVEMENSTFSASTVEGNWWEHPASLLFKDCAIGTRDDSAFLKLGVYTIGRIGFDGCAVSGRQALVHVKDLRPHNAAPETNPDQHSGMVGFRGVKWTSEAKTVVTHGVGQREALSPKKITIIGKTNPWPAGVAVATDLPESWELK